jgi:hypothetical protein
MTETKRRTPSGEAADASLDRYALNALRALTLSDRGRPKSELAAMTFGADNASSRSRMSGLSAALVRAGLAREKKDGRERIMEITDLGREELARHPQEERSSKGRTLSPDLTLPNAVHSHRVYHNDRPRFHLRHASLLALWKLRNRRFNAKDWAYDQMLIALATESSKDEDTLKVDQEVLRSVRSHWEKGDSRRPLIEVLVRFQDPSQRRLTGPSLLEVGDQIDSDAEAVLWTSAAIELAHHYSFASGSQTDRLTARRLLSRSKELLLKARLDPVLEVAADYRLAKAAKVASVGWIGVAGRRQTVEELSAPDDPELDLLATTLNDLNRKVRRADSFNGVLEGLDRALTQHVGRWIMRAQPSTEWIFRRAGGTGIAKEINDWGVEMHERGTLNDLLISQTRSNTNLQEKLKEFISKGYPYLEDFESVVKPHLDQSNALLGNSVQASTVNYDSMLLNNLWNPEMVAAHAICRVGTGE